MEMMLPTEPARIATKMAYQMNVDTLQVNQTVIRMESRTSANSIVTWMGSSMVVPSLPTRCPTVISTGFPIPVILPLVEIRMEMESWMPVTMFPSGEETATVAGHWISRTPSHHSTISLDCRTRSPVWIVAM